MSRPNVILDLDQTLISAEPVEEFKPKKNRDFVKHNMDGYYYVFERPYLQEFLTFLFKNFNVSIWTAATKDYALFIVDKVILKNKKERKLDYIFFSYHCGISEDLQDGTKALRMFWNVYNMPGYSEKNTLIVDDYDEVRNTQPDNCIVAPSFEYNNDQSVDDTFLKKLIKQLKDGLEKYEHGEDIRSVVKSSR